MTDHFSVIGFKASSAQELAGLLSKLPEDGAEPRECGPGYYYRWSSDAGSELWIHMKKDETPETSETPSEEKLSVIGVTPFFAGEGRMKVRVMTLRQRPSDNAFEGAAFVEIEPGPEPHQCTTVALFDLVDFACTANRATPFVTAAQITAFPHDLAVFADEAAFQAAQEGQEVKFAPKSFFASGLFTPVDQETAGHIFHDPEAPDFRAPSKAFFTGVVEKSELRRNSVTDQSFRWVLVATLGGTIDIVADENRLKSELTPGTVVQGEFWLCGRLVDAN